MKMLVIGGTGLIGSRLVEQLRGDGHELADAIEGAQVVVDVSEAPAEEDVAALLTAETAARVGHHVLLSVVGADLLPESGALRAKLTQENAVKSGPVPYTILRATTCFESIGRIADERSDGDTVRLPPVLVQPESADDVACALADLAVGSPLNDTVELAGPEAFRLDELARRVLKASGDRRQVTTDPAAHDLGAQLPGDDARIATTHFEDWLRQSTTAPSNQLS
jgi:uncharacterized protein YbjT (DUF2867 family)